MPNARKLFLFLLASVSFFCAPVFADENDTAAPNDTDDNATIKPAEVSEHYVTTQEMRTETQATIYCLEHGHILKKELRSIDANEIIRNYADNLDALHLFFFEPEIKAFQTRHGPLLDIYFQRGNLLVAFDIYKEFLRHVENRVAWIEERLAQPFDLNSDATFVADRSKLNWPENETEADELWEKRLKLDLILELLGEEKKSPARADNDTSGAKKINAKLPPEKITQERLSDAVEKVRKRYNKLKTYLRFEPYEVEEIYLNTLTSQYDPHTTFFSKQAWREFEIAMRNSLCGVGAILQDDEGYCTIKEVLPGGPIEGSKKIKAGDRIIALGQGKSGDLIDIVGMRLNKVVNQLRGDADTYVRLRIEPVADRTARYTITLKRGEIKLTTQLAKASVFEVPLGDRIAPIGVIDLPAFYGGASDGFSTSEDVRELIKKLKQHKIEGLVLDLRRNGGGLLDESVKLAGLFFPKGPVLQVRNTENVIQRLDDTDAGVEWDGPLIVLVTKLTASASEIVAGALQDHKRAIIVGDDHTHGKGSVQAVINFGNFDKRLGSASKVTIQKWYLPSGNSIQLKGVAADIPVSSVYSVLPLAESDLKRPLPWDAIPSVLDEKNGTAGLNSRAVVSDDLLKTLLADSERRQVELPEFTSLNRTIAWTKSREKDREYPINYEKLYAERAEDKIFRESIRDAYRALENTNFKSTEVKLNAALKQEKEAAAIKAENEKTGEKIAENDTAAENGTDDITDEWPEFDVQKRESLRIMRDWISHLTPPASLKSEIIAHAENEN